jgi:F0F1-type ATP synthase membrane subunit a
MNTRVRGLITFGVILAVAIVGCVLLPFVVMPGAGTGVALPVITVPGEVVVEGGLFGVDLTNTIIGTIVVDILLVVFVVLAWRASKGWTKEVPGRFQSWVEWFIGDVFRSFMKGIGGERLHSAPLLWPLVATIFIFLLAGNWMKLLPGVETVGKMHCSHVGLIGYPARQGITEGSYTLYVDSPLDSGIRQTTATEEACYAFFNYKEFSRFPVETVEQIEPQVQAAETALRDAEIELDNVLASVDGVETLNADQQAAVEAALSKKKKAERALERQQIRLESAQVMPDLEREIADIEARLAALHGSEGAAGEHGAEGAGVTLASLLGEATGPSAEEIAAEIADLEARHADMVDQLNHARTQMAYPTATITFTQEQLDSGAYPFLFHVTPFVRGPATDMSVAVMLALLAIVVVQVYGVWALGPAYFEKFINISALGKLGKKPLGLIDFVVGLFEIVSELGKIISLAFRLFGNLFAGGVALIALTFLVALLVPMVMYGLEIIIGTVQALVFAVLTLVFAVQAMEGHHGDEDHEHAEEH